MGRRIPRGVQKAIQFSQKALIRYSTSRLVDDLKAKKAERKDEAGGFQRVRESEA